MNFSLRQMQIFATIAKTQNVSHAAERLYMSQSAASSALVDLEKTFQRPLFDRVGKSLQLNATGQGLLPLAESLLAQAAHIQSYLSGEPMGPLQLGATLTIGNYFVADKIAAFKQHYPTARLQLQLANTDQIVAQLLRFECDLGLLESEVSHPDLLIEPWLEDELVIFAAADHELAQQDVVSNVQLAEQSWILREVGSGTRSQFDRVVASQLQHVNVGLELSQTEAIKSMVLAGLGLGCLSRLSLHEACQQGQLVILTTPQFNLQRRFYFARHKQRSQHLARERFMEVCSLSAN